MGKIRIGTKMALLALSITLFAAAPALAAHVAQGVPHGASGPATGSITGRITFAGGDPAFVQVVAYDAAGNWVTQTFTGSEEGDASGSYSLTDLAPGNYKVLFNADGWGPFYNGRTSKDTADLVAVAAGETTTGIDDDLTSILSAVTTAAVTNVGMTSATCGGSGSEPAAASVSARGVCWSTSPNPTINDAVTSDGSGAGSFASSLTGLSPGTTYHVRAYCTNDVHDLQEHRPTTYGADVSFTTLSATDSTPPTTTTSGADALWHRSPVTVTFAAVDDAGGSGMSGGAANHRAPARTLGAWTTGTSCTVAAPASHAGDGVHTISYRSTDVAGNTETAKQVTVKVDTTGPVTAAKATSGRRGRAITLRYSITDNLSPKATAIRIVVRNSRGAAVKTIRPTARNTATWYSAKWTPKARGTYRYYVYVKDLAGNGQSKVESARVVVR